MFNAKTQLLNRVETKSAVIGIVGLGYVGLPLLVRFVEAGFRVIGFDVDITKIDLLNAGKSYIKHISDASIAATLVDGRLEATADFSRAREADVIILCVPTPLNKYREPDLQFVMQSIKAVLPVLHSAQLISLESTTYPGTTEEELKPYIESCGLKVGNDVFLVFSPEREDPGNELYNTKTIPKVLGGVSSDCLDVGVALYSAVID